MENEAKVPKFPLGRIVMTSGAAESLTSDEITAALRRHIVGDWGELDEGDRRENGRSLEQGFRLLSAYRSTAGEPF